MARKGKLEAEARTQQAHQARLLYLSRNPEFRKDIESLTKHRNALPGKRDEFTPERLKALGEFRTRIEQVGKDWGVPWLLLNQLSWPGWHTGLDHKERIPAASVFFDPPVIAWTDAPLALFGTEPPKPTPKDTRYLNLRVDLDHPADTLLLLIERELSRHSRERLRGRRRLDQVDLHVHVFDLAESGDTFKAIAQKLKRRPSTVKSAYLAASRHIFGTKARPSKKALPLASFDWQGHCQKCRICLEAETPEEMCPKARLYADLDHKGQGVLTGYETVRG